MDTSVDMKLLKQTKFPQEFNQKVDMQKVNKEVMKKWTAGKISEILGGDDDVVIELCSNLLEQERFPSIKKIQIQLTGFLDKDAGSFCKELWALCLSAQTNPQGVPKELLEAKKLELIQEKIQKEKAAEVDRVRRAQEAASEQSVDRIRQRERGERRGRGGHRFERGGRPPRRSRSRSPYNNRKRDRSPIPPPRRYSRSSPRRYDDSRMRDRDREVDSYIPSQHRGRLRRDPRARSHSSEGSRSPIDRRFISKRHGSRSPNAPRHRQLSPRRRSPPRRRRDSPSLSRSPPPRRRRGPSSRSSSSRRPLSRSTSASSPSRDARHNYSLSRSRTPDHADRTGRHGVKRRRSSSSLSPNRHSYRHSADYRKGRHRDSRQRSPARARSSTPMRRNTSSSNSTPVRKNRTQDSLGGAQEVVGD